MFIPLQKMVSLLILAHFRIVSPKTCTQNVPFFNLESPIFFPANFEVFFALNHSPIKMSGNLCAHPETRSNLTLDVPPQTDALYRKQIKL